MKKVVIKVPAKINLTLDILGVTDGYHDIESLVASINLYDTVTIKERVDGKITLQNKGLDVGCPIIENNAYKAAKLFVETFGTYGVDIVIDKKIPVSGGLGGSSADIAGVLNAMNDLYGVNGDMTPLAVELGSDSAYMLHGGYAVLKGRGDEVEIKDIDKKLYLLIITCKQEISARKCYQKFDQKKKYFEPSTARATEEMYQGDEISAFKHFKNDLQASANDLSGEIKHNLYMLKKAGAEVALVAGSGPSTIGFFADKKVRDIAYKKIKPLLEESVIKAETVVKKDGKFI